MISTDLPGWAQRMVTASFRDVSFLTESHDTKGGRRLAIHEFPGAEQPVVEDLGGKADEFHLNAYFIGPDYDLFRNQFLLKLNTPGAAWLRHPWLGSLWVRAHNWQVHESNDKGGYCAVSVDFVPGGMVQALLVDRADQALAKIKWFGVYPGYETALWADKPGFGKMPDLTLQLMSDQAMASLIKSVNAQLTRMRNLISLAALPLAWANQARNLVDGLQGDMAALLALPAQYSAGFGSFSDLLGGGADVYGLADTARPRVVTKLVAMSQLPVAMPGGAGDSPALRINGQRVADFNSRLLLASAAQVALADYRTANDRDAVLASVVAAFDAMLPRMSDPVFQAALDCRAALTDALLAQELEPAVVRDIVAPLPATVLAHRMEVDEDVFLAVNKVRHPLFVRGRVYG